MSATLPGTTWTPLPGVGVAFCWRCVTCGSVQSTFTDGPPRYCRECRRRAQIARQEQTRRELRRGRRR